MLVQKQPAPLSYAAYVRSLAEELAIKNATGADSSSALLIAELNPWKPLWWQQREWRSKAGNPHEMLLLNTTGKAISWPGKWVDCASLEWTVHEDEKSEAAGSFRPFFSQEAVTTEVSNTPFLAAYPGEDINAITTFLKGYSQFVQWQKSSMRLHLLVTDERTGKQVEELLQTYRYRQQVTLVGKAESLLSGAYAYIHWVAPGTADILLNTAITHRIPVAAQPAFSNYLPGLRNGEEVNKVMAALYREEAMLYEEAADLKEAIGQWPSREAQLATLKALLTG